MFSTKHKKRIFSVVGGVSVLAIVVALVLYALGQNLNLFYAPHDIATQEVPKGHPIRVGGMVVKGSVQREKDSLQVHFVLTDFKDELQVSYNGILPDLFREGQGIVANGILQADNHFIASEVLAKHDENYMPPEVKAALDA